MGHDAGGFVKILNQPWQRIYVGTQNRVTANVWKRKVTGGTEMLFWGPNLCYEQAQQLFKVSFPTSGTQKKFHAA